MNERKTAYHKALEEVLNEAERIEVRSRAELVSVHFNEIRDRDNGPTVHATATMKVKIGSSQVIYPK